MASCPFIVVVFNPLPPNVQYIPPFTPLWVGLLSSLPLVVLCSSSSCDPFCRFSVVSPWLDQQAKEHSEGWQRKGKAEKKNKKKQMRYEAKRRFLGLFAKRNDFYSKQVNRHEKKKKKNTRTMCKNVSTHARHACPFCFGKNRSSRHT